MEKMKVLGIAGSIRKGSNNRKLLRAAIGLAPENMLIEEFDIKEIPMYNPDLEKEALPEIVAEFKKKIRESDGILIATPEYNYSIPGALKNAIDWASRPPDESSLELKPLAIMGGSGGMSGTIRAQGHLRQILAHFNMMDMKKPEVLVTMIQDKFDEKGSLKDEKLKTHLVKFLNSFENWINQFRNRK